MAQVEIKKEGNFLRGDLVLVKFNGLLWPARITEFLADKAPHLMKYGVFLFGVRLLTSAKSNTIFCFFHSNHMMKMANNRLYTRACIEILAEAQSAIPCTRQHGRRSFYQPRSIVHCSRKRYHLRNRVLPFLIENDDVYFQMALSQKVPIVKGMETIIHFRQDAVLVLGKEEDEVLPMHMGRFIWVPTPTNQLIQLQLDYGWPSSFQSEKERRRYEKRYELSIKTATACIKAGYKIIGVDFIYFQCDPTPAESEEMSPEEFNGKRYLKLKIQKLGHIRFKVLEQRWLDLHEALEISLMENNPKNLLLTLADMLPLPLDPLILKKKPHLIFITQTLVRYGECVGDDDERELFLSAEEKSSQTLYKELLVRGRAKALLRKIERALNLEHNENFAEEVREKLAEFQSLTKHMSEAYVKSLTIDPSSPYFKQAMELSYNTQDAEFYITMFQRERELSKETFAVDLPEPLPMVSSALMLPSTNDI